MKRVISIMLLVAIVILLPVFFAGCSDFDMYSEKVYSWKEEGPKLDKYLYEKVKGKYIAQTPMERFFDKNTHEGYLYIYVQGENESLDVEYFGKWLVKEIVSVKYSLNRVFDKQSGKYSLVYCTRYTVKLHFNNKLNLLYVAIRLSKLSDVFTVDALIIENCLLEAPNDPYYSREDAWGLDRINVEKVWDFSKGLNKVYVAVMDTGIYPHEDLVDNLIY